jgi:hypothetical protein
MPGWILVFSLFWRARRGTSCACAALSLGACSPAIDLPAPRDLTVRQLTYGPLAAVEVSWRLVLRVDRYLLHYDDDRPGAPYSGAGLSLVRWPLGCGDFDGGGASTRSLDLGSLDGSLDVLPTTDMDGGPSEAGVVDASPSPNEDGGPLDGGLDASPSPDARWPGFTSPSPFSIPAAWCLDHEESFTDAGRVPVETPGTLPRVRITGLSAGRTYHFAVQVERKGALGPLTGAATIAVSEVKAGGS